MWMANNLEVMIAKAGMTKREVANLKGITPETLSRHVHGKIQMTLQDAEQYGKILDCLPQDVLFATKPIPIMGYVHITMDNVFQREIAAGKRMGKIYANGSKTDRCAAVVYSADEGYAGRWYHYRNAIALVQRDPIEKQHVSSDAIMNESFVLAENPPDDKDNVAHSKLFSGIVYPEPGGTYTVHTLPNDKVRKGLRLVWATPILSITFRPDLRDVSIVYDK